ncbi:MAG: hypothetical protein CVU72_02265, partial [Deltaproteobacteria bacterium HGW-Deltaproteobacteria-7]
MNLQSLIVHLISSRKRQLYLIGIITVLSQLITVVMNIANSLIWWGRIDPDLLLIGCIDSFIATSILAPLFIYLIKKSFNLDEMNHQLQKEANDRGLLEEALKKSEDKYRTLIETTDTGFVIIDQDGRVQDANPEYVRLSGHAALSEIMGRSVIEWTADYEKEKNAAAVKACFDKGYIRNFEIDYVDAKGAVTPIELNATCLEVGGKTHTLTICRDISERRKIENELQNLASIVRHSSDLINLAAGDGKMIFLNEAGCEMVGIEQEMVNEHNIMDIVPDHLIGLVKTELLPALRRGAAWEGELQYKNLKTGSIVDVYATTFIITNPVSKAALCYANVSRNITDRKRADMQLKEAEHKFRTIADLTYDWENWVGADGKLIWVSPSVLRVTGYSVSECMSMPDFPFPMIHPDYGVRTLEKMRSADKQPQNDLEFRIIRKDGAVRWVAASTNPVFTEEGQSAGHRTSIRDVTDRKLSEDAVRRSEEKYRTILESIDEGYFEQNLAGDFIFLSDSMYKIYGYPRQELMGMNYKLYTDKESGKKCLQVYRKILETGKPDKVVDFDIIRKDATRRHIESSVSLQKDSAGNPIAFRGVVRDVTDRRKADKEKRDLEERLQRAEKMEALGTLAGGVAHDLNNVLGVIVGYAELLLAEVNPVSPVTPRLTKIMSGSEKAAAIVQDLLTLARRGVPGRKVLNLNRIIYDYQHSPELEKQSSYHSGVRIKLDLDAGLLNISGSAVHLGKVIANLAANAFEAMPLGGTLTIKTANQYLDKPLYGYDAVREGDYVVLSVTDTGEGIAPADLQRIFEPFYTKKVMGRSGTGLGLAVVWGTMKDHHGYIELESKPGQGSSFTLYFPSSLEEMEHKEITYIVEDYQGKGETILVVDDVKEQREIASKIL